MSESAGGVIIVAAPVLVGAALILGAGYLVFQGGYRAIKSCKEAWEEHLKALEEERQKRLAELRQGDEEQMRRLEETFLYWAQQGEDFLSKQKEQALLQLTREQEEFFEAQRKTAQQIAIRKRIDLLESEVQKLRRSDIGPPLLTDEDKKRIYHENLLEAKKALEREQEDLMPVDVQDRISAPPPPIPVTVDIDYDTGEHKMRLAKCRALLASLLFLQENDRKPIQSKIQELERALEKHSEPNSDIENNLDELEHTIQEGREKDKQHREARRKVWEEYLALHERYITAKLDQSFGDLIKDPIRELKELLDQVQPALIQPENDQDRLMEMLLEGKKAFHEGLNQALLDHQRGVNRHVRAVLEEVLHELGYADTEAEEIEGGINLKGRGAEKHKGAEVTFSLSPEGYLSVDLSPRGFKNQTECTQEFDRIQGKLCERGIWVKLDKLEDTWTKEIIAFLKQELKRMGYPDETITVKDEAEGTRIVASSGGEARTEIVIDSKSGEWTKAEGPKAARLKEAVSSVEGDKEVVRVNEEVLQIRR